VISILTGKIIHTNLDKVVVDVSGVGFEVGITPRHSLKLSLGSSVTLFTRMIVKEDDISLFGFESMGERELFDQLCSVSGIGPKLALTTLSGLTEQALRNAIADQDELVFKAIPGIGPKTAKLIILSLTGKVGLSMRSHYPNVISALSQLGTDDKKAAQVVSALQPGLSDSEALKLALSQLGTGKLVSND
jgi:Holliday junction DNA helicase RuvA